MNLLERIVKLFELNDKRNYGLTPTDLNEELAHLDKFTLGKFLKNSSAFKLVSSHKSKKRYQFIGFSEDEKGCFTFR